jgi:CMP-N,N'-diacetyllegionaminic acid synthase
VKHRLCTINVRGGSKGVPGKNWANVAGIPLVSHSIRQAFSAKCFDMVAVSSDSETLLELAASEGAIPLTRPVALATDSAPKMPAIVDAVEQAEAIAGRKFDTVVDLDATSPLRTPNDISNAINLLESDSLQSLFSACESRRSPYFNLVSKDSAGFWGPAIPASPKPTRRQDAPSTFDMNASIYVWNRDDLMTHREVFLEKTGIYLMPEERSIDIDSPLDFEIVSWLMERRERDL